MSTSPEIRPNGQQPARVMVVSSLYVGGGSAAVGASVAAFHATLQGLPTVLWSAGAGAQCFVLGSSFWLTRSALKNRAAQDGPVSSRDDLICSTLAGSFAGLTGGAIRGRGHIIPGAVMLGLVGLGGQAGVSALSAIADAPREKRPLLDRLSDSSWWPLKSIPDEDYERSLNEKLVRLEAEMAIIDDQIAAIKSASMQPAKDV